MLYKEPLRSRQIYNMNRGFLEFEKCPYGLRNVNVFYKLHYYLYLLKNVLRYLLEWDIIDKQCFGGLEQINFDFNNNFDYQNIKIAVYTCILGKYDDLLEPVFVSDFCDYFAITDSALDESSIWQKIDVNKYINNICADKEDEKTFLNRWVKMHPHEIFPQYDYSLYVDGNVQIMTDIMPLLFNMLNDNNFISIHKHWSRKYLKTEAKAIRRKKNIDCKLLEKQLRDYKESGYKDDIPLLEATIILRKHNDPKCIELMKDWWKEFCKYSPRDQMSLPYVIWKNNLGINDITIMGENKYLNPRFYIKSHN